MISEKTSYSDLDWIIKDTTVFALQAKRSNSNVGNPSQVYYTKPDLETKRDD